MEEIARENQVSYGFVRTVIDELKQGKFAEYHDQLPYLNDLHWLSQQLKKMNRTLQEVIAGTLLLDALTKAGTGPPEMHQLLKLLRGLSPPGYPREAFVNAALRLARLEEETGLGFPELEKKAASLRSEVSSLESTRNQLTESIGSLRSAEQEARQKLDRTIDERKQELQRLEQMKADQLADNRITEQRLTEYLTAKAKLASDGISFDNLEVVRKILSELEGHGWQAKTVLEHLKKINSLTEEVQGLTIALQTAQRDLDERKKAFIAITSQIAEAKAELEKVGSQKTRMLHELTQIKEESDHVYLRNEWGSALEKFLTGPLVEDQQIIAAMKKLGLILQARENARGLPVDYEPARKELLFLVEAAGKKLVPRDVVEQEMNVLRNMNSDLLIDRVAKLETERNKLTRNRIDLELERKKLEEERARLSNISEEKLLMLAAGLTDKGQVHVLVCVSCGFREAYQLGVRHYSGPYSCPCCYGTLKRRGSTGKLERVRI